jgi:hypothetical protein
VGPSSRCTALPQLALGENGFQLLKVTGHLKSGGPPVWGFGRRLTIFQHKTDHSTKFYKWPQTGQILTPYARREVETLKEIDYLINLVLDGMIILKCILIL